MARLNSSILAPQISETIVDGGSDHSFTVAIRYLDVLASGVVTVESPNGNQATYTFTAFDAAKGGDYSTVPYRIHGQIAKVIFTGKSATTVDPANLVGWV